MKIRTLFYVLAFLMPGRAFADEPSAGEKLYALHLKSLFAEKCLACHGSDPDDISGGFDMRTRESMLLGGETFGEDVLRVGKGRDSKLHSVTTRREEGFEMPPKEAEKLTEAQTNWVRQWIDEGAPWPDDQRVKQIQDRYAEGTIVKTSGGLNDDWTNRRYEEKHLWAYKPLNVVAPPESLHPIDWFLNRAADEDRTKPANARKATAEQLVRRLSFNLTGLPPERSSATQNFLRDYPNKPVAAIREYVKALHRSPHYGEHFARQWLDVTRYADSAGFANDYARPNAWRYRDYVVRAFNNDKPYDEFIRQQIAGDEIDPGDPENLIATGYLRMGPWEHTGMSVFRVTRQQWLDDVTDSVGQTFLGHALQCAKCHDHKFDPVPTRDYYSMAAVFSTTQFAEVDTPFLPEENQSGFAEADAWVKAKVDSYSKQRGELNKRVAEARQKENGDAKVGDNGLDPGDEASLARMGKNIQRHNWELDRTRPIAFTVYTGETLQQKRFSQRQRRPKNRWSKEPSEPDHILTGGDVYSRGAKVQPGPLSVATNLGNMKTRPFPAGRGKRRLALANWIAAESNPLTARVMVNRIWTWHFGRGLAGNPNNFGATGKQPTHPELLDYLADWFMKHDWSVKQLNELILTSAAYRVSSLTADDVNAETYASFVPRRLTAEELRDAMLAVSGELNRQVGGIPCRPDINREVALQPRQIMGGTASVYEPDPLPDQRNRRTIYTEKIRGVRDPFMEAFNQPGPDKSCELRETSTVAPQALTLINAEEVQDRALAFAASLLTDAKTGGKVEERFVIEQAFHRALSRKPTETETAACLAHWKAAVVKEATKTYEPRDFPTEIERTVMAEKTGEPYTFIEVMPAYKNYVPDLQPSQTTPQTRALAQVCLVLFNLNEFSYVD